MGLQILRRCGGCAAFMANKLKVQEQEAISNLSKLGWGIRRIARELGLSRNTVRAHVRTLEPSQVGAMKGSVRQLTM